MEEIDAIIIETLKNLHCDVPEEINNLKLFDTDMVVLAISTCLEAITKDLTFPKKLPHSMSMKLKTATYLAEQIKELGFRGDIGYQTIIYYNEVEVRRILMFLIERLPKENIKMDQVEDVGFISKLLSKLQVNLRRSLEQTWLPVAVINRGVRPFSDTYTVHSFKNSVNLYSESLSLSSYEVVSDNDIKDYFSRVALDVTKQCNIKRLIPSLLFSDVNYSPEPEILKMMSDRIPVLDISNISSANVELRENLETIVSSKNGIPNIMVEQDKLNELVEQVKAEKNKFWDLNNSTENSKIQLLQLKDTKNQEEELLKTSIAKIKIKTKALAVANKEENLSKLKLLIENGNERLVDLANQWNDVQTPLLEEYKNLQDSLLANEMDSQQKKAKCQNLIAMYQNLLSEMKEKESLVQVLTKKLQAIPKGKRSAYTRRILEIIGNIKKQNVEIQKVLRDTKEVQKEINSLSGRIDRSFTIADELIFHNAKANDTSRKAYKLLVALRDECASIMKVISDLGSAERELRNLQEQYDAELSKEIPDKLEKVLIDLEEIKNENTTLLKQ